MQIQYTTIITCLQCGKQKEKATYKLNKHPRSFCSRSCRTRYLNLAKGINTQTVNCLQCNREFKKRTSDIRRSPRHFCCQSCVGRYTQLHRTWGNNVSLLEKFIQGKLKELYPRLDFIFNGKTVINSELDIYIPSLKLAFELNGPFHYEPIFGQDKLIKTQNNDNRKMLACAEHQISLCVLNTASTNHSFHEKTAKKHLDIIVHIINEHMAMG